MKSHALDVVGLFPSHDSAQFGGIQSSAREAWQGILRSVGEPRARALFYRTGGSRAKAILQAARNRRTARVVLVWHLHLLKLLPFLDSSFSRVVLFLHGIEAWMKQDSVTRFLLRKVDLILSNSDHTWKTFLSYNPDFSEISHRTVHLGTGCCQETETPRLTGPPAVTMIGRLCKGEDYKGHREVIEAWPSVLNETPDAQLWIIGDGDLRPSLEELADARVSNHSIKFFGAVPDNEKERLIARSSCVALPSRGEGFGLVYLEAMRMSRPCLVSTADAGREIVNPPEAGLAVDPSQPGELANALCRLLNPGSEWEQWSNNARSRYARQFTGEHFQRRIVAAVFGS